MLGKFIDRHREDSLTAAVFTHLLHLPVELFWQILREACYSDNFPAAVGEPISVDYWPKWDPTGTGNTTYIEPDVFIRFADFDLIVEAKRWDDRMQDRGQWERELIAYVNEYGEERREVRLLAVGGIHDESDATIEHQRAGKVKPGLATGNRSSRKLICPVHKCRWKRILNECRRLNRQPSQSRAVVRILTDVIDLFAWHGYSTGRWFADFDFSRHRLSGHNPDHCNLFRERSRLPATP